MWRRFQAHETLEALAHADQGGFAVQSTGFKFRGEERALLLAVDEACLLQAAQLLGLQARWMLRPGPLVLRPTFELFGAPLRRALDLCSGLAAPPAAPLILPARKHGKAPSWR